jgi:tetratricopeptide (TPR) repeat protein
MTTFIKALLAGALAIVGIYLLQPLLSSILYYLLYLCGLAIGAVIVYQLVAIIKEDSFEYSLADLMPAKSTAPVARPNVMRMLPREESIILEWAAEYLETGNPQAASSKLEKISSAFRNHPDVLDLQCRIFQQEKRWRAALDIARRYSQAAPEKVNGWLAQALCLHHMDLTEAALDTLLPLVTVFPNEHVVAYDIARYSSRLGRFPAAQQWIGRACTIGGKANVLKKALVDPDFEALRHHLGREALVGKIISGGQTGADRSALDFAISHGIPHGGWCPHARVGEDGTIHTRYNLTETPSSGYQERTEWNVRDSDATVIFSSTETLTGGTLRTAECAKSHRKPCLLLQRGSDPAQDAAKLLAFIQANNVKVLNVAGPSASKDPRIGEFVNATLKAAYFNGLKSVM